MTSVFDNSSPSPWAYWFPCVDDNKRNVDIHSLFKHKVNSGFKLYFLNNGNLSVFLCEPHQGMELANAYHFYAPRQYMFIYSCTLNSPHNKTISMISYVLTLHLCNPGMNHTVVSHITMIWHSEKLYKLLCSLKLNIKAVWNCYFIINYMGFNLKN